MYRLLTLAVAGCAFTAERCRAPGSATLRKQERRKFFHFFPGSGFLSTFLEQQRYVPRKTLPALGRMSPQSATFRHSEYGSIAEFGFVALDFWKILERSLVLDRFHKFLWN